MFSNLPTTSRSNTVGARSVGFHDSGVAAGAVGKEDRLAARPLEASVPGVSWKCQLEGSVGGPADAAPPGRRRGCGSSVEVGQIYGERQLLFAILKLRI